MSADLLSDLQQRAFKELIGHDEVGPILNLDYQQTKIFKQRDHSRLRPILDKQLRGYKRSLGWMGIGIPVLLTIFYWWLQTAFLMIPLTLLYIVEVAFLLKISIPRIAAMERACALFDAHDELLSPTPERETSVATRQNT